MGPRDFSIQKMEVERNIKFFLFLSQSVAFQKQKY